MSITIDTSITGGTAVVVAPGGAGTPAPLPSFVTTTSICTGHETSGLCARATTTTHATTTTVHHATTTEAHALPSTGAHAGLPMAGGGLLVAGVLAMLVARHRIA